MIADALVLKIREGDRVRSLSGLLAIGVNAEGCREILGLQIGDSESEGSWTTFFAWLKRRGLSGVDLVVSDAHGGLVHAVHRHFQGATWQRCQTHFARDIGTLTPKALRQEVHDHLRSLFEAPDLATFLDLVIRFGWGGFLFGTQCDTHMTISHDEWILVESEGNLRAVLEAAERLSLTYKTIRGRQTFDA